MKTDLETFTELAKKLGYSVVKEKAPEFKPHTETSKNGYKWTEIAHDTWKDETSGLTWYDKIEGQFTYEGALNAAEVYGAELPKASDFIIMVENGGMEFLPNLKNNYFWSSSPYPTSSHDAYLFYGGSGGAVYGGRPGALSVRCVGR